MAENKPQEKDELEHRKGHSFPLVVDCDMLEEMQSEATDLCVTGESGLRVTMLVTYPHSRRETLSQLLARQ